MDRARRTAAILAVLLASATPASARIVGAWQCGEIDVELHKYATKLHELRFSGTLTVTSPTGKPTTGVNPSSDPHKAVSRRALCVVGFLGRPPSSCFHLFPPERAILK
jgi:hypothetical protein